MTSRRYIKHVGGGSPYPYWKSLGRSKLAERGACFLTSYRIVKDLLTNPSNDWIWTAIYCKNYLFSNFFFLKLIQRGSPFFELWARVKNDFLVASVDFFMLFFLEAKSTKLNHKNKGGWWVGSGE